MDEIEASSTGALPSSVMLLRRLPSPGRLAELIEGDRSRLWFLHGDAAALAEAGRLVGLSAGTRVEVCATSWDRRLTVSPDPRVTRGSLATLFRALETAAAIRCLGCGGDSLWREDDPGPGPWLLELGFAPDGPMQAREALELVLAAAALELDARVLFRGPGYNHLLTDAVRGWAQLTDFDLLELYGEVPEELVLPLPVRRVSGDEVETMLRSGGRRLVL